MIVAKEDIMSTPVLDETLKDKYVAFAVPADQLLCSPSELATFCDLIRGTSEELSSLGNETIARRLLQLRKLGQPRGGLPRLKK